MTTSTLNYRQMGTADRDQAHALFSRTMGYIEVTAALFAAGAWLGRDLTGATALFIAGFGAAGYATRRDLAPLARLCFWALVALIVVGIVLTFFLDVLNLFLFFLDIFSGQER